MQRKEKFYIDWWLILILGVLITISIIALLGSKGLYYNNGFSNIWGNNEIKQLMWVGVSIGIVLYVIHFGNGFIRRHIRIIYLAGILSLLYILVGRFIPIIKITVPLINGAYRWIVLPGGFQLQPSEFVKIIVIFAASALAANHTEKTFQPYAKSYRDLMFRIFAITAVPVMLIFVQPDTGIPVVIIISIFAVMLASGIPWRYIFTIIFTAVFVIATLYLLYTTPFTRSIINNLPFNLEYRFSRIEVFLTGSDSESAATTFQTISSLTNIGSAGFFGHGFQQTAVFTPESQTDFIFTIIASDFGFFGAIITILFSLLLDIRFFQIIRKSQRPFDIYTGTGFILILIFQQLFNIGMAIGLLPVKGMTLPFISYGGTSLLSYAIIVGFMLNTYSKAMNDIKKSQINQIIIEDSPTVDQPFIPLDRKKKAPQKPIKKSLSIKIPKVQKTPNINTKQSAPTQKAPPMNPETVLSTPQTKSLASEHKGRFVK